MNKENLLPTSEYIDTTLGLKYLNNNKKLYLKILNRFLTRYKAFDIKRIDKSEFKNEMHTLKGLSSTLGMEHLTHLAKKLYDEQSEELFIDFSKTLQFIISDLNAMQPKSILIITDKHDEIDSLLEILEDSYDIMVTITLTEALESISTENIDIVLLNPALKSHEVDNILKQKSISMIEIPQTITTNTLRLAMKNI